MYTQKVISKRILKKCFFFVGTLKVTEEKSRIRIRNSVYRSQETDPYRTYQNVTGPKPWISGYLGPAEKPSLPPPDVSMMVGSTSDLP
jgi:hypothetical protein